jgi:hypothetical protein
MDRDSTPSTPVFKPLRGPQGLLGQGRQEINRGCRPGPRPGGIIPPGPLTPAGLAPGALRRGQDPPEITGYGESCRGAWGRRPHILPFMFPLRSAMGCGSVASSPLPPWRIRLC